MGQFLNTKFEAAMVSKNKTAYTEYVNSLFNPKQRGKPTYQRMMERIESLENMGALNKKGQEIFLEDLVADKLGISVSGKEVAIISEKAAKIDAARQALGSDLGNPAKANEIVAFFEAKKNMDDYLLGLMPANKLRVLTGTIGRGMMLASVKSPIINIGTNLQLGVAEAISRRIGNGKFGGGNTDLAVSYIKLVNRVYTKTGYDISRMTHLADTGRSGSRLLDDVTHSEGPGFIRGAGRIVEDVVFKNLMGAPDIAASSIHFADAAGIHASVLAKGDKGLAREYMRDAMRIEPLTRQGEAVRTAAILDAQTATWTNASWASRTSEGIRRVLNDVSGDARVGDFLLPFVKTPANVIATGINYSGITLPAHAVRIVRNVRNGDVGTMEFRKNIQGVVRAGFGLTVAYLIAAQIADEDFVGAYDPKRKQIEELRGAGNYNAVRIGGKWVSVDWLGPLSVPFTGMMYARKYGDGFSFNTAWQYTVGVGSNVGRLPGVQDIYESLAETGKQFGEGKDLREAGGAMVDYTLEQLYSRLIPSGFGDLAKVIDPVQRTGPLGRIPVLSKTAPARTNVFEEELQGESAWIDILFGARVKKDRETPLVAELSKVSRDTGKGLSFTDWDKSSSKQLTQFKEKVGPEKFEVAKKKYGQELKKGLEAALKNPNYKQLTPEDKLKAIAQEDSEAMDLIFKQYGFKYKEEKTNPLLKGI
jgi:hypothetical protein